MRPSRDEIYLKMAHLVATRGTCLRRQVGCVLVDGRGRILATGYNGVAAGRPHCNDQEVIPNPKLRQDDGTYRRPEHWERDCVILHPHACAGAGAKPGENLDACEAIHAEQNAILLLHDPWAVDTAYVTTSPCVFCMKLLLGTSCHRIVTSGLYPHARALEWWEAAGRTLEVLTLDRPVL